MSRRRPLTTRGAVVVGVTLAAVFLAGFGLATVRTSRRSPADGLTLHLPPRVLLVEKVWSERPNASFYAMFWDDGQVWTADNDSLEDLSLWTRAAWVRSGSVTEQEHEALQEVLHK